MSIDVDLAMHALHRDSARLNQAYMEDDVDQAVKVTVRMMLLLAELLTERTQREVIMRAATLATEKDQQAVIMLINSLQVDLQHMLSRVTRQLSLPV